MATDVRVSLTIEGTDTAGKKTSTKIPYINPTISNETMKDFAEKCAALSADTYIGTTKTTEEDITNGGKPAPTPSSGNTKISKSNVDAMIQAAGAFQHSLMFSNLSADAQPLFVKVQLPNTTTMTFSAVAQLITNSGRTMGEMFVVRNMSDITEIPVGATFTVIIPETETTAEAEITYTVVQ